jgi:hypothetical protein
VRYTLSASDSSGATGPGTGRATPSTRSNSTGYRPSSNGGARITTLPAASITNELPSNTSSSWPPSMFTYTTGRRSSFTQRPTNVFTVRLLAQFEGRGIDHHEHLGAGGPRQLRGLGLPDVLADQQPDAEATELHHRRLRAGLEVTFSSNTL